MRNRAPPGWKPVDQCPNDGKRNFCSSALAVSAVNGIVPRCLALQAAAQISRAFLFGVMHDIARKDRQDLWVPAEQQIYEAILEVEAMPADPILTDAITLLAKAKSLVSDYVDNKNTQQNER